MSKRFLMALCVCTAILLAAAGANAGLTIGTINSEVITASSNFNLTAQGNVDWMELGTGDHKSGGAILNPTNTYYHRGSGYGSPQDGTPVPVGGIYYTLGPKLSWTGGAIGSGVDSRFR